MNDKNAEAEPEAVGQDQGPGQADETDDPPGRMKKSELYRYYAGKGPNIMVHSFLSDRFLQKEAWTFMRKAVVL